MLTHWLVLVASLVILCYLYGKCRKNSGLPHPPGPRGLPLVGNIRDVPSENAWLTYARWSIDYGSDLIRINILGNNVIIVNSAEAAEDLLDKKGAIYSDRPTLTMLCELCGFHYNTAFLKYGNQWKSGRRAFQRELGPQSVKRYRPVLVKGTNRLLGALLSSDCHILDNLQLMTSRHILGLAYGIEVLDVDDPYIAVGKATVQAVTSSTLPGSFLVDTFPILKYVPAWLPGAGFQRKAAAWKRSIVAAREETFAIVKGRMAQADSPDCVAKALVEAVDSNQETSLTESDIKSALGTMYAGGTDTTMSALGFFVLGMILYPDVQARAQVIIDEACDGRLPTFDDQPNLPYVDAVVKEVLRWHPVLPLNVPHVAMEDGIYRGYFIPKGTQVISNSWAILHDEKMYPDPSCFNPDRWMKDGQLNTDIRGPDAAFGAGRRICAGRHMAYEAIWITVARVLAAFDLSKAKDERGDPITPKEVSLACYPKPFPYEIRPRTRKHEALVHSALAEVS